MPLPYSGRRFRLPLVRTSRRGKPRYLGALQGDRTTLSELPAENLKDWPSDRTGWPDTDGNRQVVRQAQQLGRMRMQADKPSGHVREGKMLCGYLRHAGLR